LCKFDEVSERYEAVEDRRRAARIVTWHREDGRPRRKDVDEGKK
jgi:hypothetical protein